MRRCLLRALPLVALLLAAASARAQAPPPPQAPLACEDQFRASQIQLQAVTLSQIRERGDAAQAIAALQKRVEQLAVEVARLRAAQKPKPEPTPAPKAAPAPAAPIPAPAPPEAPK